MTTTAAINPPRRMEANEKLRLRSAAHKALKLYPGPVGELISREILVWEDFGYRIGGGGGHALIGAVVDHIMKTPLPSNVGYE